MIFITLVISLWNSDYVKINSVNPLYFIISEVDGYIEESNGNKYLTLFTDKNKKSIGKIHGTLRWN